MHLCIETLTSIYFTFPSQAYMAPSAFWHHFHFSEGGQIFGKSTIHIIEKN
jgi:hypothetical protein